jgi:hypothetical protein
MKRKLTQISFVVVGNDHNPTILNPDFLRIRGIVPEEWGWKVDATITTPALGFVRYANGIVISVEHEKLQVVDVDSGSPAESKAAEIASRYVQMLPHVRYAAVGTNFSATVDGERPAEYLKDRFLKPGKWDSATHRLEAVGLRFVYPLKDGRIVVSLDLGEAPQEQGGEARIDLLIVNANFHRDCSSSYPTHAEVLARLELVQEDWSTFNSLMRDVLDIE